jgi:predicted site-specific integrase-resolvase
VEQPTHLTYEQAAAYVALRGVKVSHKTMRRWGRNGLVKVIDLGHRTKRVTVRSIERMLEQHAN